MKLRRVGRLLAGCVALAAMADSCAPVVTIENNTDFTVRAIVTSGKVRQVLSPGPGESASAEAQEGPYTVYVIPDQDWLEWATAVRDNLSARLADPKGLTTAQIEDVITQLRDIRFKIEQYEAAANAASDAGRSDQFSVCHGRIAEDGGAVVEVTHSGGKVFASCR
jgi:hypothetical protein